MGFLITVLLVVIVIAGALSNYWDAIESLPESSAAFLGALAGVGGGLLAILAGALANAQLNRNRDERLRNAEIDAVTNALVAELKKLHVFSNGHATKLRQTPRATFRAPDIAIFEKMTGQQLGLLNPNALLKLVEAHYHHELLTRHLNETIGTDNPDPDARANDATIEIIAGYHDELAKAALEAIRALNPSR